MKFVFKNSKTEQVNEYADEAGADQFMKDMRERGEHRDWDCIDWPGKTAVSESQPDQQPSAQQADGNAGGSVGTSSGLLGSVDEKPAQNPPQEQESADPASSGGASEASTSTEAPAAS
jgi:hypothetical protein